MKPQKGLEYANKAIEISEAIENDPLRAIAIFNRAKAFIRSDIYDSAMMSLDDAEVVTRSVGDERLLLQIINEKGYVYGINGRMDEAFETTFDLLRMLDSLGTYPDLKIHTLIDIGELYRSQTDGANAIKYYDQARELAKKEE